MEVAANKNSQPEVAAAAVAAVAWRRLPCASVKCKMEAAAKQKIKITNQPEVAVMSKVATFLFSVNV